MSALFAPAPLSAHARFVGAVDATRERTTPCPRTLEEAFGPAAHSGVLIPMSDPVAAHQRATDRLVLCASLLAGAFVLARLAGEALGFFPTTGAP